MTCSKVCQSCEWTIIHDSVWYENQPGHWVLNSSTASWDANGDNNYLTRSIQLPTASNLILEYDYQVQEAGSPESGCSGKGIEWWGNHTHLMVYVNGNKVKTNWGKWTTGQLGKQRGPFSDSIELSGYSGQTVEIKFQASGYNSGDSRPYGDYKCWCGCGIEVTNIKLNADDNIIYLLPCGGQKLFTYYCDSDHDTYFSKTISGWCFGANESCVPSNCTLIKGNDCNDNNFSVHPNATETTCNGVDENCDGLDKCNKKVWSSDLTGKEKNAYYSYEKVYAAGSGFEANKMVRIYITWDKNYGWYNGFGLTNFYMVSPKDVTTDANGNIPVTYLWTLPYWGQLPSGTTYYDIVVDENKDGKYQTGEAVDDLYTSGFWVDPVFASDESGEVKEKFDEGEKVYINGVELPVNNTNITLYIVPDYNDFSGSWLNGKLSLYNVSPPIKAEIDENGSFKRVIMGWDYAIEGYYDVIPDFDNNGILDDEEKNAMDDKLTTGFSVIKSENGSVLNFSINLYTGWNLISIPLAPENTSIKSVLASVEGKYTKVGAWVNGTGKHYIPDFPFSTLTDIDEKMGFWIKMNQPGTLTVGGYIPANRKITLQVGWNLVGYLSANKTQPLASALSSISGNYTKVGAWVNGTGKHYIPGFPFNTLINMSEGYGYWIKMNSSGVLEYV